MGRRPVGGGKQKGEEEEERNFEIWQQRVALTSSSRTSLRV